MQTTETKSKHTPGPWDVIPQNGAGPMIAHCYDTGNDINPTGLRLVCHVLERKASQEVDRANARLIAAAPELLEALKGLLAVFAPGGNIAASEGSADRAVAEADAEAVAAANAAIAKAEGR